MNGLRDEEKLLALFPAGRPSKLRSLPEALADRLARLSARLPAEVEPAPGVEEPEPQTGGEAPPPAPPRRRRKLGDRASDEILVLLVLLGGEASAEAIVLAREKLKQKPLDGKIFGRLRSDGEISGEAGNYKITAAGLARVGEVLAREGRR